MVSGNPAASQPFRPTLMDCSPTWETHPVMLSSIRPGSTPARLTASFSTSARRSTGWMALSDPSRFPIGVRTASTMTASRISGITTYRSVTYGHCRPRSGPSSIGRRETLEGPLDEVLLLELVDRGAPPGGTGALWPSDVAEGDPLPQRRVEASMHELVRAHVLGLLLSPPDGLGVRVARQLLQDLVTRERIELLQANDRHVGAGLLLPLRRQFVEELSGRKQHRPNRVGIGVVRIGKDLLEAPP